MSEVYDPSPIFFKLAAVLLGVGFAFALMPFEAYEAQSFMVAVILVSFAALAVLAVAPFSRLRAAIRSPVVILALLFWAVAGISVLTSDVTFVSFIYFCFFSVFPLVFLMSVFSGAQSFFLRWSIYALGAVTAALAVFALVQYFFLPEWLFYRASVAWPLSNPNSLAGVFTIGFFGGMTALLSLNKYRMASIAFVTLCILAVVATGSRGALVAIFSAAVLLFFFCRSAVKDAKHPLCIAGISTAIILVVMVVFARHHAASPLWDVMTTLDGRQPILYARPEMWAAAFEIFKDNIWTGTGIGTFFLYYPEVRPAADISSAGLMVHNDPLQFALEMGVIAPVLFYAFIVACIVRTVNALKVLPVDSPKRILILGPFFGLAAIVVHAHITFHFHVLSVLILVGVMLGFWFVQSSTMPARKSDVTPFDKAHIRWALALSLLLGVGVFAQYQSSEILVNEARADLGSGRMDAFTDKVNRAGRLSNNQNARALITASHVPLGILQLNAPFMNKAELQSIYDQVDILLNRAEAANPRLVQVPLHRAELISYAAPFLRMGSLEEQRVQQMQLLQGALKMDPRYLAVRMRLADMMIREDDKASALALLKDGLGWHYGVQNPRSFLKKTLDLARELDDQEAVKAVETTFSKYFPDNPLPR